MAEERCPEKLQDQLQRITELERSVDRCNALEKALSAVAEGASLPSGDDFFPLCLRQLTEALNFRYAIIGELTGPEKEMVSTLVVWKGNGIEENFSYELAGTPCQQVVNTRQPFFCVDDAGEMLPGSHHLAKAGVKSYLGVPILDFCGNLEGILAAFHDEAVEEMAGQKHIATLLSARVGFELERRKLDEKTKSLNASLQDQITERTRALNKSQAELMVKHQQLMILYAQVELAKKQWEKTLDCISDMVILVDGEGDIKRCNQPLSNLIGQPISSLVGKNWKILLQQSDIDVEGLGEEKGELYHQLSDRWFYLNTYPFTTGAGENISWTAVTLHDTTDIKKASEALEKAYAELKATQAKILQQEKMASIGQLAAGVAHEINNPMGFVSSNLTTLNKYVKRFAEFIEAQAQVAETAPDAQLIAGLKEKRKQLKIDYILDDSCQLICESLDGADRVRNIVQNLKTFSRVDQADQQLASINDCLESTLNIVWNELKYKATVHKEYGDILLTRCAPQQLNQVFMNLLVNAAHAIEKQGDITIKTWQGEESIFVAISDTGRGIPPEILSRIFEPFFTTKEVGKGTGLGLSITYDIVKSHNGEILVQSEVGKGTTFTVKIPVVK